jgi:O-6-methylguanine DNA methyltransferase
MLAIETLETPIGRLAVATHEEAVLGVEFERPGPPFAPLRRRCPEEAWGPPERPSAAARALGAYFRDPDASFGELRLEMEGSGFERRVWAVLRSIPVGETVSYGWVARAVGEPGAAQAVGRANGRNPIPIIVPCHRVIGADGTLTGFGGGLHRKQWLLDHESGGRLL